MKLEGKRLYIYVLEYRDSLRSYNGDLREGWVLKTNDNTLVETYTNVRKPAAIGLAAQRLKALWAVAGQCSELRIRNKNGTFGPARTYPRAADPRRSKG